MILTLDAHGRGNNESLRNIPELKDKGDNHLWKQSKQS
jgi:hypothetical protein